jgi:alanine racemase
LTVANGAATRPAWAAVDLGAIAHNVRELVRIVAPARVCAVVKAGGYGHGAVEVAQAALAAGASDLAVALPSEGSELRAAGIEAPILLLSEPEQWEHAVAAGLDATVYTAAGIDGLADRVGPDRPWRVHLKVDTGMHRVGCDPGDALALAQRIASRSQLVLRSVWTHCPVADEPENPFTAEQAVRFAGVVDELRAHGIQVPEVHAANSAGALVVPGLRHDMVRCGIAVYGIEPSPGVHGDADLRPAMALKARVSYVRPVRAGEGVSYGLRRPAPQDTVVATVPVGYADGVQRRAAEVGVEVLVGGQRRSLAGTVTMDQLMVDCGPDSGVAVGDEVVLFGRQGNHEVTATEWAQRLGTIAYEVVCGIGPRVPRVHLGPTI